MLKCIPQSQERCLMHKHIVTALVKAKRKASEVPYRKVGTCGCERKSYLSPLGNRIVVTKKCSECKASNNLPEASQLHHPW